MNFSKYNFLKLSWKDQVNVNINLKIQEQVNGFPL